uniref:Cytochrome cd1 nitrite reductase n=1 Tax=Macrostomum lignano TaxID=282301 RepID=A0A1I8H1P2_9PLAT
GGRLEKAKWGGEIPRPDPRSARLPVPAGHTRRTSPVHHHLLRALLHLRQERRGRRRQLRSVRPGLPVRFTLRWRHRPRQDPREAGHQRQLHWRLLRAPLLPAVRAGAGRP